MGNQSNDNRGGPALFGLPGKQRAPSRNVLESVVRGFGQREDQRKFRDTREQMIQLGATRLENIGTPQAQKMAAIFRSDPRAFMLHVNQFGGVAALEKGLLSQSAKQRAAVDENVLSKSRLEFAGLSEEERTPRNLQIHQLRAGATREQAAESGERLKSLQGAGVGGERKTLKGADGRQRFVGSGELVFPDIEIESETATETQGRMEKDVNGRWRWAGTGELVFPDVEQAAQEVKPERRRMFTQDGVQYWEDTLERVLPEEIPLVEDLPTPKIPFDKRFQSETQLRTEYTKSAQDFLGRRSSVGQIIELAELSRKEKNVIAQRGLIFQMFKLFDPTSTVRETEQEQIERARGAPANLWNAWDKLWTGNLLDDRQINQLIRTAEVSMLSASTMMKDIEAQYRKIADLYELDQVSAVPDLIGDRWRNIKLTATDEVIAEYEDKLGTTMEENGRAILDKMREDGITID